MASQNLEWARSLVGRDWEIFWSEGVDQGLESSPSDSNEATYHFDHDSNSDNAMNIEEEKKTTQDDDCDGSFVDDWYAGHVKSLDQQDSETFSFKVRFVGDDKLYDMDLEPSKVRPSAIGWIKRTKALLCSR